MTLALLIAVCGHVPHDLEPRSVRCSYAIQDFICSSRETHHIRDNDPALILFRHRGYPLKDAKVDLAIERVNGCDFPEAPHDR